MKPFSRILKSFPFFLIAIALSCSVKHEKIPEVIIEKSEPVNVQVTDLLKTIFENYAGDSVLIIDNDTLLTSVWINKFFSENNFEPAWTIDTILLPVADSLLTLIDSAEDFALNPNDYSPQKIRSKIKLITGSTKDKINITTLAELNILFTDVYFRMVTHLQKGRLDPDSLNIVWKGDPVDSRPVYSLKQAVKNNTIRETITSFEPQLKAYVLLKSHLSDSLDSEQYQKIIVNLERWRWEKEYYEDYNLWINIPSMLLKYVACDSLELTSRIIVGKPETPTPHRLNSRLVYFYIYPYWQVPLSIATKEILPQLKKDTSYLTKHNMDLLDAYGNPIESTGIVWKKYSEKYFPFKIRQRDGDENTLGVLKFIFPNKFDIYLHDTNARNLFKKDKRAMSHGCIRVKEAKKLAANILDCCVINFNEDSLNASLKKKERKRVDLFQRIPVHIRYFTCEADSGGINFYDDIYGLDKKMLENLGIEKPKEVQEIISSE